MLLDGKYIFFSPYLVMTDPCLVAWRQLKKTFEEWTAIICIHTYIYIYGGNFTPGHQAALTKMYPWLINWNIQFFSEVDLNFNFSFFFLKHNYIKMYFNYFKKYILFTRLILFNSQNLHKGSSMYKTQTYIWLNVLSQAATRPHFCSKQQASRIILTVCC